jgi:hypothetical protein
MVNPSVAQNRWRVAETSRLRIVIGNASQK